MQDHELQKIIETIKLVTVESIEKTVNGKINKLTDIVNANTDKLDKHLEAEGLWAIADIKWKKSIDLWREDADPYIKLAQNISGTWKFLIYVVVGLLSLIGFYNLVQK